MAPVVHITRYSRKELTNPAGSWEIEMEICNETDKEIVVHVVDNPWKDKSKDQSQKAWPGRKALDGTYVPGSSFSEAWHAGKKVTLRPKGTMPDGCRIVRFTYPFKPAIDYTDIYDEVPATQPGKDPQTLEGGAEIWEFTMQVPPILPEGRKRQFFAVTIPLPYPMWAERPAKGRDIQVAITKVSGLPRGWRVAGAIPAMQAPTRLECGDRASTAALVLEQRSNLAAGSRHTVTVEQRIVSPKALASAPPRRVKFDIGAFVGEQGGSPRSGESISRSFVAD